MIKELFVEWCYVRRGAGRGARSVAACSLWLALYYPLRTYVTEGPQLSTRQGHGVRMRGPAPRVA